MPSAPSSPLTIVGDQNKIHKNAFKTPGSLKAAHVESNASLGEAIEKINVTDKIDLTLFFHCF